MVSLTKLLSASHVTRSITQILRTRREKSRTKLRRPAQSVVTQTIECSVPMYSHLCWFVEGQATHNPLVAGSSPSCPLFHFLFTHMLKPHFPFG